MAETERENIRESTLEGLDAAARNGKHGGGPQVIADDLLHTVLRRRAGVETQLLCLNAADRVLGHAHLLRA